MIASDIHEMATETSFTEPFARERAWSPYLELAKARLTGLVLVTAAVGFVLASAESVHWSRLLCALLGTALVAGGANAFNQCMELARDRRMERTRHRPLPAGRLTRGHAYACAACASLLGLVVLTLGCNGLTAGLALIAWLVYVLLYTPLKPRTSLCTLVGAVCGAIPPMMGWSAAAGRLEGGAWVLAATLFIWQIPHFLALGWLHRKDYARGGFRMLPVLDRTGRATCHVVILYSLALLPLTLGVTLAGMAGWVYAGGALVLGIGFLALAFRLYTQRSEANARRLFVASVIYLPLLLVLMVADRGPVNLGGPPVGQIVAHSSLDAPQSPDT